MRMVAFKKSVNSSIPAPRSDLQTLLAFHLVNFSTVIRAVLSRRKTMKPIWDVPFLLEANDGSQ